MGPQPHLSHGLTDEPSPSAPSGVVGEDHRPTAQPRFWRIFAQGPPTDAQRGELVPPGEQIAELDPLVRHELAVAEHDATSVRIGDGTVSRKVATARGHSPRVTALSGIRDNGCGERYSDSFSTAAASASTSSSSVPRR